MLTQARLKELLFYNPITGVFSWRVRRGGYANVGSTAGALDRDGRRQIKIDSTGYCANKLAWLYMKGRYPKKDVDHIDRNKGNDRWVNLRLATRSQNCGNQIRKDNKLGVKGVTRLRSRYCATINKNGKHFHLGVFATIEEASTAYQQAARKLFGPFASW